MFFLVTLNIFTPLNTAHVEAERIDCVRGLQADAPVARAPIFTWKPKHSSANTPSPISKGSSTNSRLFFLLFMREAASQ